MTSVTETDKVSLFSSGAGRRRPYRSLLRKAWARASCTGTLRARLVEILMLANLLTLVMTGSVIVLKARTATKLEIDSSMRLAGVLVSDTIRLMNEAPADLLLQTLALQFKAVRHVRIAVAAGTGLPAAAAASTTGSLGEEPTAPGWFERLVAPPPRRQIVPILRQDRLIGNVTIVSQPADEISEAWNYAEPLFVVGFALNMASLVALFLLYGRVLAPLAALARGLDALQSKHYDVRLPLPSLRELAGLTARFNRTAEILAGVSEGNLLLHRKLLTAQDDERRRMALELHDEVGPCLFALDVNASSIIALTDDDSVHERAQRVVALVRQVQGINRRVLDQLRPIGLGRMALRDSLDKLLLDLGGGANAAIEASFGPLAESYGSVLDLTVYRCLQEGLFNAMRHANASCISCTVNERYDAAAGLSLEICVIDDGRGLAPHARPGTGLAGMRERVEALDGTLDLAARAKGTRLTIQVPIARDQAFDAS